MFSSIGSYVWSSGVMIGAILTILFLTVIRMYSRNTTGSNNTLGKVTEKIGNKLQDAKTEASSILEGYVTDSKQTSTTADHKETSEVVEIPDTRCDKLDLQFYGELFVASMLSGFIVKTWW